MKKNDTDFKCEECGCEPEELHAEFDNKGNYSWLCEECFTDED